MRSLRIIVVTLVVLTIVPLLACIKPHTQRRVMVLGLDGLDPGVIELLISENKLPNFSRLQKEGAWGNLESSMPMLSPILWTTMATGRLPVDHGIGGFAIGAEENSKKPVTSSMRQVKAVWNIASEAGLTSDVVGWWATWPPEQINGTIVSDHACFHFLFADGQSGQADRSNWVSPPERAADLAPLIRRPHDVSWEEAQRFIDVPAEDWSREFSFEDDVSHFRWALATAQTYADISLDLWEQDHPDLLMTYIEGTDSVSHLFGHLFRSEELAGELGRQKDRYGRAVEEMYVLADQLVGRYIEAMDENTTLMILSDHGFKLGELHNDPSVTRDMRRVSSKFHQMDGIIYLFGSGIQPGMIENAVQPDVAPTLLALLEIPVAMDMPGKVLDQHLVVQRIARVGSYESERDTSVGPGRGDAGVNSEILAHLEALGYLEETPDGKESEARSGAAQQADLLLQAGRNSEAADLYLQLANEQPDNAKLRLNLGVALYKQQQFETAEYWLREAVRIDPSLASAWNNIGVLCERQGRTGEAVQAYRRALQEDGQMTHTRTALQRLTGSNVVYTPTNEDEAQAQRLAVQAAESARTGNYDKATQLLEEAEILAPNFPLVYAYQANVLFLSGDLEGANQALLRQLELEPDNAVAKKNLVAIQRKMEKSVTHE